MEFLRNWVVTIVITMIFVTIVEIMMPSGSTRKYISLVIGLMVMFVIINPVLTLMAGDFDFGSRVYETSRSIALGDVNYRMGRLENSSREGVIKLYKSSLEQQIEKDIENKGLGKVQAEVEIEERQDAEDFGSITGIRVVITDTADKDRAGEIEKVDRITVKVGDDTGQLGIHEESMQKEIAKYLAGTYQLPEERVEVVLP
ncbi:MAG: stage III sporulation protein AF [Clostridiales bacterium]|jgi:stage III sporulation protein AF|nr:stage III sporulation protein AF [Clostridiales bacterium]